NSGPVLLPGRASQSRLLLVVAGLDADLRMPPEGKPRLTAPEIGRLRAWIDQGAKWPAVPTVGVRTSSSSSHWAFQPMPRRAAPRVLHSAWPGGGLDAFVLARQESAGIPPSPEADRVTLIRRLSLDLLGLPPTPEEVDAFVADAQPDAYERLVDRLLASPH